MLADRALGLAAPRLPMLARLVAPARTVGRVASSVARADGRGAARRAGGADLGFSERDFGCSHATDGASAPTPHVRRMRRQGAGDAPLLTMQARVLLRT